MFNLFSLYIYYKSGNIHDYFIFRETFIWEFNRVNSRRFIEYINPYSKLFLFITKIINSRTMVFR